METSAGYVSTRPQCLLLMPFDSRRAAVRQAIVAALQQAGLDLITVDGPETAGAPIQDVVLAAIDRADLIIVDITGTNPSVMIELGFSLGRGKTVLPIVSQDVPSVPFDLSGALYLVYNPSNLAALGKDIQYWALRYLERSGSFVRR